MIAVIIPTLNEEKALPSLLDSFPESYMDRRIEKFVVDGGSTDRTKEIARERSVNLIEQKRLGGKGNGVEEAIRSVDADIYVLIDGDGTYNPGEVNKLLDLIIDGEAEHVIGKRNYEDDRDTKYLNKIGNYFFNKAVSVSTGKNIEDMLSGYRAFTSESLRYTDVTSPGFGIETEMTLSAIGNDVNIKEVDISYRPRKGESKLNPISDGWRIIKTIIWSVRDSNPLRFFFLISLVFLLTSLYPTYLTLTQWIRNGRIVDVAPAIAASFLLIVSIQFIIFGLLADQIRNVERRLRR
jgi:dolichol-phosphate mannosyltransferase